MTDDFPIAYANKCVAVVIVFYLAFGFLMFGMLALEAWICLREKR